MKYCSYYSKYSILRRGMGKFSNENNKKKKEETYTHSPMGMLLRSTCSSALIPTTSIALLVARYSLESSNPSSSMQFD